MTTEPVPEPLRTILRRYCNVNAMDEDWPASLIQALHSDDARAALFKDQLSHALLGLNITPAQYEELTDEDFDTQADLTEWLRELWTRIYGSDPP